MKKHYLILAFILFLTFIFRFPSLFEPFWYGDEGIFAAVARNLNFGGVLYQDSWDNKPPMIYLTYGAIFKVFGVSMFWLRLVALVAVLATAATIYEIAQKVLGEKRALVAALAFGILSSLRVIEGNLALTEIFMILPISLAMMIGILRKFDFASLFASGALLAIASLYKQVGALEAVALGIFLFLYEASFSSLRSRNSYFVRIIKKGFVLGVGFAIPYLAAVLYFAPKGLVDEYIFAAYTYYRIYLGESPRYAMLINILKFLPIAAAVGYGFWKAKTHSRSVIRTSTQLHSGSEDGGRIDIFHLFLLWTAFSFLGSYFSGRTYGHYLIQAAPAVSLLLASVSLRPVITRARIIFAISFFVPLILLTRLLFVDFLSGGPINQISYWRNFSEFTFGKKSVDAYNDYFDRNVNSIMALSDFFSVQGARGASVYIWGDYPWLYAIADLKNPSRYVTSFHVFGVPNGPDEVAGDLATHAPDYIIKPPSSIGYFNQLEKLLAANYTLRSKIGNSDVYVRKAIGAWQR